MPGPKVEKEPEVPAKDIPTERTPLVTGPANSSVAESKETPSLFRKKPLQAANPQEKESKVEKKGQEFTQKALSEVWSKFGEILKNKGAGDAEKLILGRELRKGEEHMVIIKLGSQLHVSILEKFELELVQYLRSELQNDHIQLTKLVEEKEEGRKLYTSKDKYDYMVEQNPALKTLKDKLGLDFEY